MIVLEGADCGFWVCLSLARYWHGTAEGLPMNVRLVDLPVKSPVRVGLFEGIFECMGQRSGTRRLFHTTGGLRSDAFSPSDSPGDPGPSDSLERLVSLSAPFLSVFLGHQTCLLCNILKSHDLFLFCFFSTGPSFSQQCSQISVCLSYPKAEHISWWLNKLFSIKIKRDEHIVLTPWVLIKIHKDTQEPRLVPLEI